MLTLFEELFLLCIHENRGVMIPSARKNLPYGLNGAILAELTLGGKAQISNSHRLELIDDQPIGDEILDKALKEIQAQERVRRISYWVASTLFTNQKQKALWKALAKRLAEKGIVNQEDNGLAWVVPAPDSGAENASAKYVLKSRLRQIVLACSEANQREIVLLSLLQACNMLNLVFVKDERRLATRRIRELMVGEALKNPAGQAIEEIGAAVSQATEED